MAEQDGNQIIRNAEAELATAEAEAAPRIEGVLDLPARSSPPQGRRGLRRAPARPSAPRRWPRRPTSSGARRRSATSSPCSRSTACSRTRTPRPGRVPTDAGYRYFVDRCSRGPAAAPRAGRLELSLDAPRGRRGDARHHRDALAGHRPARHRLRAADHTTTISHVEVLLLQPQVLMVVVITSTGGVTKRALHLRAARRRRPGRLGGELSERAPGRHRPGRPHAPRPADRPALGPTERAFLAALAPAFSELADTPSRRSTSTAPRGCWTAPLRRPRQLNDLMDMLERRVTLLRLLRSALAERDVYVRIGARERAPALQLAGAGRRRLRPAAAHARRGLGDRPAADGLRARDRVGARGRARAVALRRGRLRGR